ncbi:MAG TPA: hypothetical protein VFH08_05690 [Chitinophagaceae bacterium]|nr:hypothetical protein [Chitinophagaceae bacterium]
MRSNFNRWNRLFLFAFGLFIAAAFAMKWMESDLVYNNEVYNNEKISIFGLELFYPKEKIIEIFSGINDKVRTILNYHLSFDFIFMAGCYPGIACLCMMAAEKIRSKKIKRLLVIVAFLQLFGWVFDIIENYYLLKWLKQPIIGNEFRFYHLIVYSKWAIALSGALLGLSTLVGTLFKRKNPKSVI